MDFPLSESKTLGGLYVRALGCANPGQAYAVTHGHAIFAGESHIRFMEGWILTAPAPGEWTIYALRYGISQERKPTTMRVYISRAEDVPPEAVIISEVEALA